MNIKPEDVVLALWANQSWVQELPDLIPVAADKSEDTDPSARLQALSRIGLIITRTVVADLRYREIQSG